MTIDLTAIGSSLPASISPFLTRLASLGVPRPPLPASPAESATAPETTLTPAALRAALLQIGVTANAANLLLAESFAQLGLPLTPTAITEAHVSLAQAPGASPMAYALAQSLSLPTTPDVLRALATVTDGIPAQRALPVEVTQWLSLAVAAGEAPETVATQLRLLIGQNAQSTERRLLNADHGDASSLPDSRTLLLRLARSAEEKSLRIGADTLASHMEGQQLINLAAQRDRSQDQPTPLYFALPLLLPGEQTMLEMSLWRPDLAPGEDAEEEETGWRTTIRLATSRLGRVEAELTGKPLGGLTCRLCGERPAAVRLMERSREKLAASLAASGWPDCDVSCRIKTDWPVLWHGGQALTAPRTRVDWEA